MKHLLLPILLALSFGAAAQKIHFTDTSNRWTVRHDYYNELSGKTTIDYEKWALRDTVVLGENVMYFIDQDGRRWDSRIFIQEDTVSNIVFAKCISLDYPDSFTTEVFYDFSAEVGDTTPISFADCIMICREMYPNVTIEGLDYKAFEFGYEVYEFSHWGDFVIESIGSLTGPFAQWWGMGEYLVGLTCFEHKGVQVDFSDYFANDCKILSMDEKGKQSINLSLFPNPANRYINIEVSNSQKTMSLSVFDILGREVYKEDLQNTTKIDVSTWADGIYVIHAKDEHGSVFSSRFSKR